MRLAATGLVLATTFALLARYWWAFDLFSHFRLQYIIAALIFCVLALVVRAYPTAAVLAATAVLHGWAIKDLWLGGEAAGAAAGVPLRVASANVLNSNAAPEKVFEFVRASGADLVVLVDARRETWDDVLSKIAEIYPHRAPETWRNGAPVVLFSRHPVLRHEMVRPQVGRRPYILAQIALDGRTLTVAGVHPSSPSPTDSSETRQRNYQLDHIADNVEVADQPVIVTGDFNTTPFSPHFRDLLATAGLRNAASGHGWYATWPHPYWPVQIPLDHVLVKGPIAVADFARGPAIGSDHYPVIADLRIVGG